MGREGLNIPFVSLDNDAGRAIEAIFEEDGGVELLVSLTSGGV